MLREIVPIKGETKFTINLDPSVWIFDKRKIDLDQYREQGELITVAEREVSGSYGIPFAPFLLKAEPDEKAMKLVCHVAKGDDVTLTLPEAMEAVIGFSQEGKPLGESGPLHLYFGPKRHHEPPITHIVSFEVKI